MRSPPTWLKAGVVLVEVQFRARAGIAEMRSRELRTREGRSMLSGGREGALS